MENNGGLKSFSHKPEERQHYIWLLWGYADNRSKEQRVGVV